MRALRTGTMSRGAFWSCTLHAQMHHKLLVPQVDAAKLVGLNVVRLMNETTAVAAAYGLLRPPNEAVHVLFLDVVTRCI